MTFKHILINNDFCIASYQLKENKKRPSLKCQIKKNYPTDVEFEDFINSLKNFYNNIIDENLEFKIKLDIKLLGFIGFNKIYQCVKCFINPDTKIINERLLINTTIFIENEKLKYLIESIFYLLKPTKPILIKTKNKDETLDYSETDKNSAIELTEEDLKNKLNINNIDEIKLHN